MGAKLRGKVSLITGGNSGIGRATARLFSAQGARVVIAARDPARGQRVVDEIARSGGQGLFIPCDVCQAADCRRAVERSVDEFGCLDILVNSAGVIYPHRSVLDTSEEEWDRTMAVNVKGVYLMSRFAIPCMIEGGGGSVINVASVWGLTGGTGAAAYCASKGAVVLLTKAMALDHAGQNVRVNCICPGSVDTPMLRDEMAGLGGVEQAYAAFAARHPLNRICAPDEVAQAALYLASDAASFVTGSSLVIDGGRTAGGRS